MNMDKLDELAALRAQIAVLESEVSQEVVTRMSEIENQINALIKEGTTLADKSGLTFDLGSTALSGNYGMGGLRYIPRGGREQAELREEGAYMAEEYEGWVSSSSPGC